MGERVYLDHNATTPIDERVLEAMLPFMREHFGNASSVHREGRLAKQAIEQAREQVAALVGAHPSQVVFTSGGTEANNLALKGVQLANPQMRLAVSAVEHASVLVPGKLLGADILPVDGQGRLQMPALEESLARGSKLVSVMLVNNETGVIEDIAAVAEKAREHGALLHTDAVQAAGKIDVDMDALGVQMMSLSAHKIYGPKGIGALVVDKAVSFEPLLHGGGHEKGRRAGTQNVPAIVGFGKAAELAALELEARRQAQLSLRERLEQDLLDAVPGVEIFSRQAERVTNTCYFSLPGIDGEALLLALDEQGFAVSSGSACDSKNSGPSHVLTAMGIAEDTARGAIRVGLGQDNTQGQVDALVAAVKNVADSLGRLAQPW
jgi:cysteine desulfurase